MFTRALNCMEGSVCVSLSLSIPSRAKLCFYQLPPEKKDLTNVTQALVKTPPELSSPRPCQHQQKQLISGVGGERLQKYLIGGGRGRLPKQLIGPSYKQLGDYGC